MTSGKPPRVGKRGLVYSLALAVQAAVRFGAVVWAAAMLGPDRFALWPLAQAIMGYSMVLGIGALVSLGRDLPFHAGREDRPAFLAQLRVGGYALSASWALCLAVGAALALLHAEAYLLMGIVLAVMQSASQYFVQVRRAKLDFRPLAVSTLLSASAMLPPLALLLWVPHVEMLFLAFATSLAVQVALCFDREAWQQLSLRAGPPPRAQSWALVRSSVPLMAIGFLSALFFTVDRWALALQAETLLGAYALPVLVATAVQFLVFLVGQVYYPALSHELGRGKPVSMASRTALEFLGLGWLLAAALAVGSWLAAPWLVGKFLPQYAGALPAAQWIAWGGLAVVPARVASIVLQVNRNALPLLALHGFVVGVAAAALLASAGTGSIEVHARTVFALYILYGVLFTALGLALARSHRAPPRPAFPGEAT